MVSIAYGDHPSQIVHRHAPRRDDGPAPVAVLLHGGWWRDLHDAHLMDPLAEDLAEAGWAVWNVEYRRTGADGGGWPRTVDDVARALDLIAATADREGGLDTSRVVAIGHSAGGHLGLMTAADSLVTSVVALAPITDLRRCADAGLGEDAVAPFLGPDPTPELYAEASPLHRLPIGVPQLIVHGADDQRVPVEHSRDYTAAARAAGDRVDHHEIAGADHFAVIDPAHTAWRTVRATLGTG